MTRYLLRFSLWLIGLLIVVVSLLQTRPYDNHELPSMFEANYCPQPCFLDIRPGYTTLDGALMLLMSHAWVRNVDNQVISGFPIDGAAGWLRWEWSGRQPRWIDDSQRGEIYIQQNYVNFVRVKTRVLLGDIRLNLGTPERQVMLLGLDDNHEFLIYQATYMGGSLAVESHYTCGVSDPFLKPVVVQFHVVERIYQTLRPYFWNEIYELC